MKFKFEILLVIVFLVGLCFSAEFRVRIGIQNDDITFADWYNYFGISPTASDEWDSSDMLNMSSPEPHYIDLYFPHDDSTRPDYWEPPYSGTYCADIRDTIFTQEIFYFDIFSTATTTESVAIFWVEEDSIPPSYKVEIIPRHENGVNIFHQDTLWRNISPGVHYFSAKVIKNVYDKVITIPEVIFLKIRERIWVNTYLVGASDTVKVPAEISAYGESALLNGNILQGIREGVSHLILNYRGFCDTTTVVVAGIGPQVTIPVCTGWNLISFPVKPTYSAVELVIGRISPPIYEFDGTSYTFTVPETIQSGKGYFIFSETDTFLQYTGNIVPYVEIPIQPGWNAIGGPTYSVSWNWVKDEYDNIFLGNMFNVSGGKYRIRDVLVPGRGYWVFSKQETTITISQSGGL
ncbi:hypothetical protein DRQ33_06340 [bacterium]|nr:MAG: hypothetical protein DRQ33_06340 [bacterium]